MHMLRREFPKPVTPVRGDEMQTRDSRISVSAKSFAHTAKRPSSSSRAYLAEIHILEPRFTKVIPG